MSRALTGLFVYVVIFHVCAFVGEVFLWMQPSIHEFALLKLNAPVSTSFYEQALILEVLFINQGFYNLLVAFGGLVGFALVVNGRKQEGLVLLAYMCFFAFGAGVVLLATTKAYIAGFLQATPALIALILVCRNGLLAHR